MPKGDEGQKNFHTVGKTSHQMFASNLKVKGSAPKTAKKLTENFLYDRVTV